MPIWRIERHNGLAEAEQIGELPGGMSDSEVEEVLRRLACKYLTEEEILTSSLRRGQAGRKSHLDRIGAKRPIQIGENPYFLAVWEA